MEISVKKQTGLLLAGVVVGTLTDALAGSSLTMARLDLMGDIHTSSDEFAWLDITYTALKMFGFLLMPWCFAQWPPLRCFRLAVRAMVLACVLIAVSGDYSLVCVLRSVQGLAAGVMIAGGQAILFQVFPREKQLVIQSFFALSLVMTTTFLAPAFQGWLVDNVSWTLIFLYAAAIGLIALALLRGQDESVLAKDGRQCSDYGGAAAGLIFLFSFTYISQQGNRWNWWETPHLVFTALVGLVALMAFIHFQIKANRRPGSPALIDRGLFAEKSFLFVMPIAPVAGAVLMGSSYLIPNISLNVLGLSATAAGEMLAPGTGLFILALLSVIMVTGRTKFPPIAFVPCGILMLMIGLYFLSGGTSESGPDDFSTGLLFRAAGLGFLFLPMTFTGLSGLKGGINTQGVALFNLLRQAGGMIGIAALQTSLDAHKMMARTSLSANIVDGQPLLTERIEALTGALQSQGLAAGEAAQSAWGILSRSLETQVSVLAFNECFLSLALIFLFVPLFMTPYIFWLRRRFA